MKLLDWMHRKFRNGEPLKEFATAGNPCICLMGQPSLDHDFEYYPKSNYNYSKPSNKSRENQIRRSFACLDAVRTEHDEHMEEESSAAALSEMFHGFLAIGTLGNDPVASDPATPTFSRSVEYIMEKETEATENELQFINDELEKELVSEDDSSGRTSYVSNGRSSHGSMITLSGKVLEASENENGPGSCPLQGYLFGSAVGMPETTSGKKEHRTSLGELFQKTKLAEENGGNKINRVEKQREKETEKSAVQLMKKILKGKKGSGGTVDTASTDKKLHKILHMFHRKVHPENTTKSQNQSKHAMNSDEYYKKSNQMHSREDTTIFLDSKNGANSTRSNMPQTICGASDSNGNKECWIKSDADYLVLEL